MPSIRTITSCALAALSTILPNVAGHSWIEEFQVIDSNGSYIGDRGYPRGYVSRTDPDYNGFVMDYLVPSLNIRINETDSLCHPSQRTSNYTNSAYPKLTVTPGSYVAAKYLENGHVTLPWNQLGKPPGAGTVFVYGTTKPSNDEKIADVLKWTTDGNGGNGNGFLLTAQNFDDGRCHQINCGNISIDRQTLYPAHVEGQPTSSIEQWCETDLKIPETQPAGTLSIYWVWQWPTEPGHDCTYPDGKDEYYTTCADFEVIAANGGVDRSNLAKAGTHTLVQENPQSTAVSDFKSRTAFTTSPPIFMISGSRTIGQDHKATNTAFAAQCSASGNQAPNVQVPAQCAPVSVFTGAALASASDVVAKYVTTLNPQANAVATPTGAQSPAQASSSVAPTSYASPNAQRPAAANGPDTVTVTEYTTVATTFTTTVPISSAISSAPAVSSASTYSALSSAAGNGIVFQTISTVTAPLPGIATAAAASSSASSASHVGADRMVMDVAVDTGSDRFASEHATQHMHRRAHARGFTARRI